MGGPQAVPDAKVRLDKYVTPKPVIHANWIMYLRLKQHRAAGQVLY